MVSPSMVTVPLWLSTVVPGKLPVFWLNPVRALNRVDFPQFGLPERAIWSLVLMMMVYSFRISTIFASLSRITNV